MMLPKHSEMTHQTMLQYTKSMNKWKKCNLPKPILYYGLSTSNHCQPKYVSFATLMTKGVAKKKDFFVIAWFFN